MCDRKKIKYRKNLKKYLLKIRDLINLIKKKAEIFEQSESLDHFLINFLSDESQRNKIIE